MRDPDRIVAESSRPVSPDERERTEQQQLE
jgi:hypothetical protein